MNDNNGNRPQRLTLTVEEASEVLGISRATGYNLVSQGRLPALRISDRRIVVPRKAIDDMLALASSLTKEP